MPSLQTTDGAYRRVAAGTIVALVGLAAFLFLMLPVRSHLTIAAPALVFVVPVILGVVVGGFVPGAVGAVAGFVLYDIFFLPPYGTLSIRAAQDWIALVVYVVVVLIVARVVTNLQAARQEATRREEDANRLFELSQALIGDFTLPQLLEQIVATVQALFAPRWTVLLLPDASAADRGRRLRTLGRCPGRPGDHRSRRWCPSLPAEARPDRSVCPVVSYPAESPWHWWQAVVPWVCWCSKRCDWPGRTGPCSEPSPTRPRWPSNGHSSRTRCCGAVSSKKSIVGAGP